VVLSPKSRTQPSTSGDAGKRAAPIPIRRGCALRLVSFLAVPKRSFVIARAESGVIPQAGAVPKTGSVDLHRRTECVQDIYQHERSSTKANLFSIAVSNVHGSSQCL